jgi:hypothetical protein
MCASLDWFTVDCVIVTLPSPQQNNKRALVLLKGRIMCLATLVIHPYLTVNYVVIIVGSFECHCLGLLLFPKPPTTVGA